MPKNKRQNNDTIVLGSGKIYFGAYNATVPTMAEVKALCVAENELGAVKGGAILEYKETHYQAKDDSGRYEKEILTEDEASLKCGIITFNGALLDRIVSTAKSTEENGYRITDIGGTENYADKSCVLVFHHEDKKDGDIWVVIRGVNQAGFSLAFAKDKESTVEPEFKCKPMGNDGVLIRYIEEIAPVSQDTVDASEEPQG